MTWKRRLAAAASSAARAESGIMLSSSGSARLAPKPRNKVRRPSGLRVIIILRCPSHRERYALDDTHDYGMEAVIVVGGLRPHGADGRHVIGFDAAAQGIDH